MHFVACGHGQLYPENPFEYPGPLHKVARKTGLVLTVRHLLGTTRIKQFFSEFSLVVLFLFQKAADNGVMTSNTSKNY